MLEAELFAFLEKTADAAFAVTKEGQICSWNQAAERLFGYSAADVLNRACYEVLDGHGALGTQVCSGDCSIQQCAAQKFEIPDFDLEVKTRSGQRLWVNVSTLVFDEPRRNRHLIVHLARDIVSQEKRRTACQDARDFQGDGFRRRPQHARRAHLATLRTRAANPSFIRESQEFFRDRPRTGHHPSDLSESSAQHQREAPYSQPPGSRNARHATWPHLEPSDLSASF